LFFPSAAFRSGGISAGGFGAVFGFSILIPFSFSSAAMRTSFAIAASGGRS
jgi:hypothetical protein